MLEKKEFVCIPLGDEDIVVPVKDWIETLWKRKGALIKKYKKFFRKFGHPSIIDVYVSGTQRMQICADGRLDIDKDSRIFDVEIYGIYDKEPRRLPTFEELHVGRYTMQLDLEIPYLFDTGLDLLEKKILLYQIEESKFYSRRI